MRKIDDDIVSSSIEIYFTPPKNVVDLTNVLYLTDINGFVIYTV